MVVMLYTGIIRTPFPYYIEYKLILLWTVFFSISIDFQRSQDDFLYCMVLKTAAFREICGASTDPLQGTIMHKCTFAFMCIYLVLQRK